MTLSPLERCPRLGTCSGAFKRSSSDVRVEEPTLSAEDLRRTLRCCRSPEMSYMGFPGERGSGIINTGTSPGTGTGGICAEGELGLDKGEWPLGVGGGRMSSWGGGSRIINEASASGIKPSSGISACRWAGEYIVVRADPVRVPAVREYRGTSRSLEVEELEERAEPPDGGNGVVVAMYGGSFSGGRSGSPRDLRSSDSDGGEKYLSIILEAVERPLVYPWLRPCK